MYEKFEMLLKEKNVTTADVASATGISQSVFSNWKTRGGNLSLENIAKVAKFFNVPIESFLKEA